MSFQRQSGCFPSFFVVSNVSPEYGDPPAAKILQNVQARESIDGSILGMLTRTNTICVKNHLPCQLVPLYKSGTLIPLRCSSTT